MQLDPVEPRFSGAPGGIGEQTRHDLGQRADMRQVEIGHPLPVAHPQRLEFARGQDRFQRRVVESGEAGANPFLGPARRVEAVAVVVGDSQELGEKAVAAGPPPDRQEVDDLDQQPGPPAARPGNGLHQGLEARDEPVVADAQQRAARNVAYPRRLDHDRAGASPGETLVPAQHLGRDDPVPGRPPRHHRGNPGSALKPERADFDRLEQAGRGRLLTARPAAGVRRPLDALRRAPHASDLPALRPTRTILAQVRAERQRDY